MAPAPSAVLQLAMMSVTLTMILTVLIGLLHPMSNSHDLDTMDDKEFHYL
jgi:hypothetical protein